MELTMPLYYHRQGLMPIPVNGKASLESWKQYQEALAPEHTIRDWFLKHTNAGVALLTGPVSKIIVLDLDGQHALDAVKKYPMPKTWIAKTRKGYHYYFQWDDRADFPTTIVGLGGMQGVDVRGRGGYVVAPPSYDVYSWVPGYAPWDNGLAPLPEWLLGLLSHHKRSSNTSNVQDVKPEMTWLSDLLEGVGQGERHGALIKLCGYYLSRMPEDIATHHLVEWNEKNNPPMKETELISTIKDMANRYKSGEYKSKFTERTSEPIDDDDTPLLPVNVSHFLDSASPKIDWFVQNLIPYQTSTIVGGMQGIGKSWALLDLAVEAARGGGKWFNYLPVNKARVLYVDEESHENLLRYRLKKLVAGKGIAKDSPLDLHFAVGQHFSFTNQKKLAKFKKLLGELKPDLIIMDSLICFHSLDENMSGDMRRFFHIVKDVIDEFKCTFLFADHEGKGNPKDKGFQASHRLRGSSAKGDAADTVISMAKKGPHLVVEHTKARYYKPVPKFASSITDLTDASTVVECLGYIGD